MKEVLTKPTLLKTAFALIASCTLGTGASAASDITPSSYEQAVPELRSFCIERLCLGMTIREVTGLGLIEWKEPRIPDGTLTCVASGKENKATGQFTASDGMVFEVGFEPVKTTGPPVSRYRLAYMELKVPNVTRLQVDRLTQTLLDRYRPMSDLGKGKWGTETESERFFIIVGRAYAGELSASSPAQIMLLSHYRLMKEWISSLPTCQARLPKV